MAALICKCDVGETTMNLLYATMPIELQCRDAHVRMMHSDSLTPTFKHTYASIKSQMTNVYVETKRRFAMP